jgi:hypothetical protein
MFGGGFKASKQGLVMRAGELDRDDEADARFVTRGSGPLRLVESFSGNCLGFGAPKGDEQHSFIILSNGRTPQKFYMALNKNRT